MVLPADRKLFLLCLMALPLSAAGVEFGALTLRSALGEPLEAEIEVSAEAGERLRPQCFRGFAARGRDLPTVTGARVRYEGDEVRGRLQVSTTAVVSEPALQLGIETDCGGSRAWRELPLLLKPSMAAAQDRVRLLPGGEWVIVPGESPASMAKLLYPGQPGVQRRFVSALIAGNPAVDIDPSGHRELPVGTVLQMPDWRALGSVSKGERASVPRASTPLQPAGEATPRTTAPLIPVRQVAASAAVSGGLRLSTSLADRPLADERLRQMLRIEYRLLQTFAEQLSASGRRMGPDFIEADNPPVSLTPPAPVPVAQAASPIAPPPVADAPAAAAANVAATSTAPPPSVHLRQSPPEASSGRAGSLFDWLPYVAVGGACGIALIVFGLYRARRHPRHVTDEPSLAQAETMVLDTPAHPPVPAEEPAPVTSSAAALPPLVRVAREISPDDVNPVMELAEIMLSFGRLQGAAQTLQEYIEANPKETLKPWIKLLDIYRQGNMPDEFDALADKLHRNFNVECQRWDGSVLPPVSDRQIGRALHLEELPHICTQLIALWGSPQCLDYLQKLLRDNRGGERNGFTLPVVQEILFLIDIHVGREAAT
jgi:pilus assembly protein FimV